MTLKDGEMKVDWLETLGCKKQYHSETLDFLFAS